MSKSKHKPQRRSLLRQGYGAPGRTQRKTFIVVKANTKAIARRARAFIDSESSYRINKNKPFADFAS